MSTHPSLYRIDGKQGAFTETQIIKMFEIGHIEATAGISRAGAPPVPAWQIYEWNKPKPPESGPVVVHINDVTVGIKGMLLIGARWLIASAVLAAIAYALYWIIGLAVSS